MAEKRYIDASMLSELAEMEYIYFASPAAVPFYEADKVWEILENAPAADVAEVKHGAWLTKTEPMGAYDVEVAECSICGDSWCTGDLDVGDVNFYYKYCPHCGAKMDGKDKDNGII